MKLNVPNVVPAPRTHGGSIAYQISAEKKLRRSVMSCLLWEDEFYESGVAIAARIADLIPKVDPAAVAKIAIEARSSMYLRHIPLFIVAEMVKHQSHRKFVRATLNGVIQRADELAEFLAIYWKDGRCKLAKSVQRGLADAFPKFNGYNLAKYNRDGKIKLRDVLFLSHAKPTSLTQAGEWKDLINGKLQSPDTWEVALSSGADKKATWERLLRENKLGGLAFLRNLRNMLEAKVDEALIRERFKGNFDKVLPFRFLAAAKYAPRFENNIEEAMFVAAANLPKLSGTTLLLVDVSGSMGAGLSGKSEMRRLDAAAALAILIREQSENTILIATAGSDSRRLHSTKEIPARRGMALREQVFKAADTLGGGGIFLVQALAASKEIVNGHNVDRIIVLTDEQDCDNKLQPNLANSFGKFNYLINIASAKNGVGYGKQWAAHIDGWSEHVLNYIMEVEAQSASLQNEPQN